MIYLTTGANGAGKTLLTLRDVRAQQLKENRPVFFHGFEAGPTVTEEFGWKPFDPKKWQDLPDGSILVMDECQNEFPLRRAGSEVPDYVNAVAQFRRKRGFDFWMICPHPSQLDVFIRRLIDKPSWHRHLKRAFGAEMVSVLKWGAPNIQCEKPGSGDSGEVTMVAYPKEVYGWYKSAQLHTGKRTIPRAVWVVVAAAVLVPVLGWVVWSSLMGHMKKIELRGQSTGPIASASAPRVAVPPASAGAAPLSPQQLATLYLTAHTPRLDGFPHTAPAFDKLTEPQTVPYPAACVVIRGECTCWTQQGTRLQTPAPICRQIVAQGFFMEWHRPVAAEPVRQQDAPKLDPCEADIPPGVLFVRGCGDRAAATMPSSQPAKGTATSATDAGSVPSGGPTVLRPPSKS